VNFAVILWLFKKFVGDKITANIVARRAELAKAEDATKIYEETLARAEEDKKALIEE
jgi:F0F1-type ATP synthase membrane subunit b/b'